MDGFLQEVLCFCRTFSLSVNEMLWSVDGLMDGFLKEVVGFCGDFTLFVNKMLWMDGWMNF